MVFSSVDAMLYIVGFLFSTSRSINLFKCFNTYQESCLGLGFKKKKKKKTCCILVNSDSGWINSILHSIGVVQYGFISPVGDYNNQIKFSVVVDPYCFWKTHCWTALWNCLLEFSSVCWLKIKKSVDLLNNRNDSYTKTGKEMNSIAA